VSFPYPAASLLLLIGLVMPIDVNPRPTDILQIYREPLKPGSEATYDTLERQQARISSRLGCPHPLVGAESLTGHREVWWFDGYESADEQQRVADADPIFWQRPR
jgi:hypothetical protein